MGETVCEWNKLKPVSAMEIRVDLSFPQNPEPSTCKGQLSEDLAGGGEVPLSLHLASCLLGLLAERKQELCVHSVACFTIQPFTAPLGAVTAHGQEEDISHLNHRCAVLVSVRHGLHLWPLGAETRDKLPLLSCGDFMWSESWHSV